MKKRFHLTYFEWLMIAIGAAGAVSLLIRLFAPQSAKEIADVFLAPFGKAFSGLLAAVAGPLVFCSIVAGILEIGDFSTFGRIGKKMFSRFVLVCTGSTALIILINILTFRPHFGDAINMDFSSLLQTIINIIPSNVVSPFAENNLVQVIFLAIIFGLAALILKAKVPTLTAFFTEAGNVVGQVMRGISRFIPLYVFFSVSKLILSGDYSVFASSGMLVLMFVVGNAVLLVLNVASVCVKCRVSPLVFLKKIFPTFVIGLTTASSNAALEENLSACKEKLGIDEAVADFGVPLGQVMYMPSCAMGIVTYAVAFAAAEDVAISVSWIFVALLTAVVVSVAVPPIPAGVLPCITVLFTLLHIPEEVLTVIVILEAFFDFIGTPTNLAALQSQLVLTADSLGMLDSGVLRKSGSTSDPE